MSTNNKNTKISKILDQIDINQLKVLIDEVGVVVLQIKNYGTLNIGNPEFDESSHEDSESSYTTSESSSSYSSESDESSYSSESDDEEFPIQQEQEKISPLNPVNSDKTIQSQNKGSDTNNTTKEEEEVNKSEKEKVKKLEEEQLKKAQEVIQKKVNASNNTPKKVLRVEEVDEDDDFSNNESETLKAAEYVAQTKQLQNGTNNPVIDKELAMGYLYVNNNRVKEAVDYFTVFLNKYPNVVGAFLGRGTAFAMLSNFEKAIQDFTSAIKYDPKCGDAYKRRGQTLVACGKLYEGLEDFNKAIELSNGKDGDCYAQRGSVYQMLKNYEKGRADFREAVRKNSMDFNSWNHLGLNNNALGLVAEAADAYARALQIKDDFIECYVNLAQLHKDAGNFQRSKDVFNKLFRMQPNHSNGHYICGVLYQQSGYHLAAIKEFTLAITNRNEPVSGIAKDPDRMCEAWRYRGVTRSASGQFRLAVKDFECAMELKSDDTAWYMKEIALYTHHHLNKPFEEWDLESFYPFFKEGFCKHLIPAALHRYEEQPPFEESISDVDEKSLPSQNVINKVIIPAMNIGKYMQYDSQGFVHNKAQYLMAGMAAIEMAKKIRDILPEWVFGGLTEEQAKPYIGKLHWRDVMKIAVKWRQISEPNDPVYWIDLLTHEQFEEGFGSHTPMFIGQTRVVRYYCQYQRAFEIVKKLLPEQLKIKEEWVKKVQTAKNIQDILDIIKSDFHVITPCKSLYFDDPDKPGTKRTYEGTRLVVEIKQPVGYEFAIKTPCTMPRWKLYDEELTECWKNIVRLVLTRKGKKGEEEALLRAMFDFTFYWYNFMPLSRGTAATGFVFMLAMLASLNYQINKHIPKGMQTDWEAILCDDPKKFEDVMMGWMKDSITQFDVESVPDFKRVLPTVRSIIECFNYCPQVKCE
ncbi:TPR repeat protein [Entamoeba histolytica HM-1:IMSS-B]|uniref:TPR repeat protein n=4 Tax=Entamoeba histolytica TaxID=5759 RepID=C4M0N5_ENTH1|nr:TPR repeat protein [Entamoeba histolytica HM-1:IMSS]EAL47585.1 TPR repeat protein [Entamoeba histolytica HM-1:IMSS]EMH75387.1 TPR repeat protein [Entamoeba histolytica HM-1:IMSS-B]ENY65179.1 tetratricopeptide repeat protein [Entamoeba histolytica HM-1:IMSS-A]GAT94731.1 tpr repeat protein [Entamoeba histolytica]|eukprot:XP_652971.1 TPR repeat protein [Entamoeba histolytica HM-1:IMSS]